ncbi:RNA-dependent RNA polymerase 1 [Reticulomyxa filosa]|uniref:RNA-dependent RNA polymerase n=1 Tax=Reticulomyxa filosa TaxID=46433 RepID=X6NFH9_RETFI|nr:RNA-dependent RNA polymerase 1 [Reticulomyxa filosa]|eukprot:ETO24494.1 RNA-dependent RNA polymerase 1 [Reticulomyxa filosa]
MSPQFAESVAKKLGIYDPVSAFQIRFGGCKGVVTKHPECIKDLQLTPSMRKFEYKHEKEFMFEVCRASSFSPCHLNRQVITLFETVNRDSANVFLQLLEATFKKMKAIHTKRVEAIKYIRSRYCKQHTLSPLFALQHIIYCGFELDIPFLLIQYEIKEIRDKQRLTIEDGASLIGVMDEYGILKNDEVFIQVEGLHSKAKVITGDVIVTKPPALAPGDLRRFHAVDHSQLHHLVNVIVFSQKGPLPPPMVTSETYKFLYMFIHIHIFFITYTFFFVVVTKHRATK